VVKTVFVDDAARLLGVSRRTVYNRIREGRLATVRTAGGTRRVVVESISVLLREQVVGRSSSLPRDGAPHSIERDRASGQTLP
jgi:excisionase family DNA binding protein